MQCNPGFDSQTEIFTDMNFTIYKQFTPINNLVAHPTTNILA